MSIISAVLTNNIFYIGTDTVVCETDFEGRSEFPGVIIGHSSKILSFPHLKAAVVGLGEKSIITAHSNFIDGNNLAGLEDLFDKTVNKFCKEMAYDGEYIDGEDNMRATLFLMGQSELTGRLTCFVVKIMKGNRVEAKQTIISNEPEAITTLMAPRLPIDVEEKLTTEAIAKGLDIHELIYVLMSEMVERSKHVETYEYPVGGKFIYSEISVKEDAYNFYTNVSRDFM